MLLSLSNARSSVPKFHMYALSSSILLFSLLTLFITKNTVNKIVEKTKTQPSNPLLSSSTVVHLKQLQSTILSDSGISLTGKKRAKKRREE